MRLVQVEQELQEFQAYKEYANHPDLNRQTFHDPSIKLRESRKYKNYK